MAASEPVIATRPGPAPPGSARAPGWLQTPGVSPAVLLALAFLALAVLGLVAAAAVRAHPYHASYAELEWSDEGTLDVALQLIPEDLEAALSRRARRTVVLVDDPFTRDQLTTYLREHFRYSGQRGPLSLIGLEVSYRETWIYFSLPAVRVPEGTLRNTILFDAEATQRNRVRRLWARDAPVLEFTAQEPERPLEVNSP